MKLTVYKCDPEVETFFTVSEIEECSNVRNKGKIMPMCVV
jgi:hypothetical protein